MGLIKMAESATLVEASLPAQAQLLPNNKSKLIEEIYSAHLQEEEELIMQQFQEEQLKNYTQLLILKCTVKKGNSSPQWWPQTADQTASLGSAAVGNFPSFKFQYASELCTESWHNNYKVSSSNSPNSSNLAPVLTAFFF